MKLSMSSLDIMVCVRELKNAIGIRVENVYEIEGAVILRLHSKERGRQDLVIQPGCSIHLTTRVYQAPKQPTSFAML
ncbi:MAG: NFACT family protein, partial [Candidatus Hadarchaeum sp.]